MKRSYTFMIIVIVSTLLLGGCFNMDKSKEEHDDTNTNQSGVDGKESMNAYEQENYVPIQEYTGEGFTLRDANPKTGEIAEENREEVVEAVESFFLDNYKTEVKVHNIVSAVDGVSVFVESIGEPHFYSFVIVPIDIKNEEVLTERVWSQEGQVESAINSGLYVMAYEEEFARLDAYLEEVEEKHPVTGMNIEVAANVKGNGYRTPYYFSKATFKPMYEVYLQNPNISKGELRTFLDDNGFNPAGMSRIAIRLFMEKPDIEPDEELYDLVYSDIESMEGIPEGRYTIILNDNYIDRTSAIGEKDNTINKTKPNRIEKD